ncbi:MAG TPA: adenylyltransferase/cytidyltransferase family protein [Thermomicrobiales bacterium]|nr:adenylyltransferase/cytidyltransferase family protein [Thermomicrobiales bacterium]
MGIVIERDQLATLGETMRHEGKRVVFTNGHFDLLHVGHLRYLQGARRLGDVLIVGVNDDATTTARKGAGRPILPEGERAELLAGLDCVDYVVIFPEPTAGRCIELLRPDIYVKGGDYGPGGAELPEAPAVAAYGGETVILSLEASRSTSEIVAAIRAGQPVR